MSAPAPSPTLDARADDETFWAERVCDGGLTFLALWTLCSHAVVFAGGSLQALIGLFAAVAVSFLLLRRRYGAAAARGQVVDAPPGWRLSPRRRWIMLAAGLAPALLFASRDHFVSLWLGVAAVLGVGIFLCRFQPATEPATSPDPATTAATATESRGLLALAVLCAGLALISHAPNLDDAFYVSLAVEAATHPEAPLLSGDPMHGVEGLPLYIPIYRVHSLEVLAAAASYLSGVPSLWIFHLVLAPLGAFFIPVAHAVLLRRLLPRHWLIATAVLLIVLAAPAGTVRWYGNLALFRPWQGKSLFLTLVTPLLYAGALRFARRPSIAGWLRLSAAQIAAVGLTSTAFFAAPVAVGLGLLTGLKHSMSSLRTLTAGVASSAYLVALGLSLKGSVVASVKAPPELSAQERIIEVFTLILSADNARLWTVV
ncbi:MAG: DUF6077 domain-containing protein, partial [Acidobacteriota bacterium]